MLRSMSGPSLATMLREGIVSYSRIDTTDADPELTKYIADKLTVMREGEMLFSEIEKRVGAAQQTAGAAANFGAGLGALASDGYNPQRDAAIGALIFGLAGAAAQEQEMQRIAMEYEAPIRELSSQLDSINIREQNLSQVLSQRYEEAFINL